MSSAIQKTDSKVIGELENAEQPPEIAKISADMSNTDLDKLRNRAIIGRSVAADVAGNIIANGMIDRDAIEAVQGKLLEKLSKVSSVQEVALIAEAMKNLVNTSVALSGQSLKAAEVLAYGAKGKRKQMNAPQTVITGDRPQIIVSAVPVAGGS